MEQPIIYTIGHSTLQLDEFLLRLNSFNVKVLADIRHYPGSKRFPHFNKEVLATELPRNGIQYVHLMALGGRRKPRKDSVNNAWRVEAFRGYADYMETQEFKAAADELERTAKKSSTCYMCSEAVWWSCHRALLSDHLKLKGWKVLHIMGANKADEHPFTRPARIENGILVYSVADLFSDKNPPASGA